MKGQCVREVPPFAFLKAPGDSLSYVQLSGSNLTLLIRIEQHTYDTRALV